MSDVLIIEDAPIGSSEFQISPTFGPETIATIELDGLENEGTTRNFIYDNKSQQPFCIVEIVINPIAPISPASIHIVNETAGYEMGLDCSWVGARCVRFVDIPSAFLSSFAVRNKTGVPLASSGNYIVITPKY